MFYRFFILIVLLFVGSPELYAHSQCIKRASMIAQAVANTQYSNKTHPIKGPFKTTSTSEVTSAYYQELGLSSTKREELQKKCLHHVYLVTLQSSDKWDCLYYVTLNLDKGCPFSKIEFHHCAK